MQLKSNNKDKVFSGIFILLTAIIVAGIFWFNFNGRMFYNFDMYSDALVTKHMWTEKTLFPENWVFGNQFYIATTPVIGALMYGLSGDSFLAMASASCIMTVLVLLSFVYCIKEAVETKYIPLGLFCISGAAIICTGVCSYVLGWQIFYTMASYYAFYFIGILLTLGIWLRLKKYGKANPVMIIVVLLLNFTLGMNSLRQTLISCLPLIGLEFILNMSEIIKQKKILPVIISNLKRFLFSVAVLLFNIAGVVVIKFLNINSAPIIEDVKLSYLPGEILKNLIATAKSIASILGFSIYDDGVKYIPLLIIATIFLIIAISTIVLIIKNKEESPLVYLIAFSFISLVCLAVTGVFLLRTRHIYYFVWYFMLACCIIYLAKRLKGKFKVWFLVIILVCGITNCSYSFKNDFDKYVEQNDGYAAIADELADDGIKYIFAGTSFPAKVAALSEDRITHGMVYWDFEKDTGKFLYPAWYIQSTETFGHTNDSNAVFAMTSQDWEQLKTRVSQEYIDELASCLKLHKSFEEPEGKIYYFYYMTEDIISDFGVIADVEEPHKKQLDMDF